jgi:hypothetical protein
MSTNWDTQLTHEPSSYVQTPAIHAFQRDSDSLLVALLGVSGGSVYE